MDVISIIQNIAAVGKDFVLNKLGAREQLMNLAFSLAASLETPSEAIARIGWAEPANFAMVRIAIDLSIFETLKAAQGKSVTVTELSKPGNADPAFVLRMMRQMAAMNIVAEAAAGEFKATHLSDAFTEQRYRAGLIYTYDVAGPSFRQLPEFSKQTAYKNPDNPVGGPFQFGHGTKDHFFPWISANAPYLELFNDYMKGYRAGKASWLDPGLFPVEAALQMDETAVKFNDYAIVDVGGGMGHDLLEFKKKFPSIKGRMLVQDRPEVISQIKDLPAEIEAMEHDFFTPQSIHGAKIYYLHSVLHDWDDEKCISLLENLKPALRPGYSKVLINDLVVPDEGASWTVTSMDLLMMALGSVKERTEEDWRALVRKAGYSLVKITVIESGSESIIELELPA